MQLTITMKLDDAAFRDPEESGEDNPNADGRAVAHILRTLAAKFEESDLAPGHTEPVRNPWSNGGPIGTVTVTGD